MEELEYNIYIREKNKGLQVVINYKDGLKWKQKSKQGFSNTREGKREAKLYGDKLVKELKKEINLIQSKGVLTFEIFKEDYIKHINAHMAWNTVKSYKNAFRQFEDLNEMELKKINNIDVQKIVDKIVVQGYKSSSITTYLKKIKALFNYAVDNNYISTSPIKKIKLEKDKMLEEKRALTKNEYELLLSKINKIDHYGMSLLACYAGLRLGEITGLTWNDIDFDKKTINIDNQWVMSDDKYYTFGELKSQNSYRIVPMHKNIILYLESISDRTPNERIFPYDNLASLSSELKRTYKRCGFDISIHELRHTYATNLLESGVKMKTVAKLLGHSIKMTMETYAHVTSEAMEDAANIINKFL